MNSSGRSRGMVLLVAGIALTASAQLNPTVAVQPKAATLVPVECEQGLAPQKMARLEVSQIPEPQTSAADNAAPPSVTLRGTLRDAQAAGERNDRAAFTDALSRAKTLLDSYPSGAERTAATDVVHVFDDVDRVWSFQFESPTGAFFDASSPLLAMLRVYPGYEAAVAENVIETGGRKLYPSRESRLFLLRESSRRLARLGVRSGTVIAETSVSDEDRTAHRALPRVKPRTPGEKISRSTSEPKHSRTSSAKKTSTSSGRTATTHPPQHHEKRAATSAKSTSHPKPVKVAQATTPKYLTSTQATPKHEAPKHEEPKHEAPKHEKAPAPVTQTVPPPAPLPAPVPATTPKGSMTAPLTASSTPMTSTAATTSSTATQPPSPAPITSSSSSSAAETSTSSTAATTSSAATDTTASTTSSAAPAPASQTNRTRNVVLPILLILVGVGVLVVLFRASS